MGDNFLNIGLDEQYTITREGQDFELQGRIMHELFYLTQFLLPDVPVRIKLYKKNPSFCLLSSDDRPDYKINF